MAQKTSTVPTQIDSKPFEHTSSGGIKFNISRCDLDGVLTITAPKHFAEQEIMLALCEMMTWHTINIVPRLFDGRVSYIKEVIVKRI